MVVKDNIGDYFLIIQYLIENHQDSAELYTSYNSKTGMWDNNYNKAVYQTFASMGAIGYNEQTLQQNDNRMKANSFAFAQGKIDKIEKKPRWIRWTTIGVPIVLWIIGIIFLVS